MIVVNIFGVPGSGKSTASAYIFYKLKEAGINCEMVTEVAKDLVWSDDYNALSNQLYIAGNQLYRLTRLEGKVDVAITDSPLMLQPIYYRLNDGSNADMFEAIINSFNNKYINLNYALPMPSEIKEEGRIHNIEDCYEIYAELDKIIEKYNMIIANIDRSEHDYKEVVQEVLEQINEIKNREEID